MQTSCKIGWRRIVLLATVLMILAGASYLLYHQLITPTLCDTQLALYSQEYGAHIWEDVEKYPIQLSLEDIIKGMRAKKEGKTVATPDAGFRQSILSLYKESVDKTAKINLQHSVEYLSEIANKPSIVCLEHQRLYYEITQHGTNDDWCVIPHSTCLFHYTITTLDNEEIVNTWTEGYPKKIALNTAIPAFAKGVIGMKKGEKRRIYAHPDFAYRKLGLVVPSQMLVIIDVEAIA
jgi:FKBP-type peptidyl-prolyl cis-trans isomerase